MAKTIVSVCDFELKATRAYSDKSGRAGNHTFVIPPATDPRGHNTLVVNDMFFMERDGSRATRFTMETAENIAADLVNEWSGVGTSGAAGPGVAVCAGDKPTDEEIASCRARLSNWYTDERAKAVELWATDKKAQVIVNPVYKRASKYLGYNDDQWLVVHDITAKKVPCPVCKVEIDHEAVMCSHCGSVVNIEQWAAREAAKEAAMQRVREQMAPPRIPDVPPPLNKPQYAHTKG